MDDRGFYDLATSKGADLGRITTDRRTPNLDGVVFDDPNWRPDTNAGEVQCPSFADAPIPEVARFFWLAVRCAGTPPPWRVRISHRLAAIHGLPALTKALSPNAAILYDNQGRLAPMTTPNSPIEFHITDQAPRRP